MAKGKDPSETIQEFKSCVNMDAKELEEWLKTEDSNRVPPTTFTSVLYTPPRVAEHCGSGVNNAVGLSCPLDNVSADRLDGPPTVVSQLVMSQDASSSSSCRKRRTSMTRTTSST